MAFAKTKEKSQGRGMGSDSTNQKTCSVCGKARAFTMCDGCLRSVCKKCRGIEIWRTMSEEVIVKSFCPQCRATLKVDQDDRSERVFGLGQVTHMVNQEQGKPGKFRIRLKIR